LAGKKMSKMCVINELQKFIDKRMAWRLWFNLNM